MNVQTNVAKNFLQLVDKHFPKEHKLNKIFNRNTVKVSYSCMPNTSNIVKSHNRKILENKPIRSTARVCKCRSSNICPLGGICQTEGVIYLAQVTNNKNKEVRNYIGATERTFKDRLYKHRHSLRHKTKATNTELSNYVWSLREKKIDDINIKWSILDRAPPFANGSKTCHLCVTEKFHIIFHQEGQLLNKRSEILSNCRHKNKFLLSNFKEIPPDNN